MATNYFLRARNGIFLNVYIGLIDIYTGFSWTPGISYALSLQKPDKNKKNAN